MVVTFLILGWGFFELSGGTDFEPPQREEASLNALRTQVAADEGAVVTRASAAQTVTILGDPIAQPETQAVVTPLTEVPTAENPTTLASFGQVTTPETSAPEASAIDTAITPEPTTEPIAPLPGLEALVTTLDVREVTGTRVNMRQGPGTNFEVITQLVQGDQAEVIQSSENGWVNIRVLATGEEGWMAARLMAPVN
ncbi:MAG: SH3 domain-containing protein [Rhodobacteraceae bacterium]|nr:SH3 domain-containing protein [Paracoccaceae bacterium]